MNISVSERSYSVKMCFTPALRFQEVANMKQDTLHNYSKEYSIDFLDY